MTGSVEFPKLDTATKCAALWPKYPEKVVGMWATAHPRQNVDVLWRLREELLELGVPVVFFFRESAKCMVYKVLSREPLDQINDDIYQLDDSKFFRLLNFVDVLVTNDYCVTIHDSPHIGAKLVTMHHDANFIYPHYWNYFYDYFTTAKTQLSDFDYSFYPDISKIHRNPYFTQLVVGYPKIDLVLEERQKNTCGSTLPILLIYPTHLEVSIPWQSIDPEKYVEMWSEVISSFFTWRPDGIVIFRPVAPERTHPLIERIKNKFAGSGRFFLDEDDDNKFWLARAKYFVTDYSEGFINFCMTAKRPAIRMIHNWGWSGTKRDEWGWTISRPSQVIPLLEEMDTDAERWTVSLRVRQKSEMPTLGQNFSILANMIKRILNNDDDPVWPKGDKGRTPCETSADMLKLVAKWTKQSTLGLVYMSHWLTHVLTPLGAAKNSKIWLPLLRAALLPYSDRDDVLSDRDTPDVIASTVNQWLGQALESLPLAQSVGLIRHLLRRHPEKSAAALLLAATSFHHPSPRKKRALFFLLMEWGRYDDKVMAQVNDLAKKMPQHFSRPVLDKLNRFLPWIMKIPCPMRRLGARVLGLKKPLAKKYWQAHRALS